VCCSVLQCVSIFKSAKGESASSVIRLKALLTTCVAVCCSDVQYVAVCIASSFRMPRGDLHLSCNRLTGVCYSVLQCVLQSVAVCCSRSASFRMPNGDQRLSTTRLAICVAVCCSVLQRVGASHHLLECEGGNSVRPLWQDSRVSVTMCFSVCCNVLHCFTVCYSVCCNALHCFTVCYSVLQCVL